MAKLSRKDKYKTLRAEIEDQAEQTGRKTPAALDKSIRLAAPDSKAEHRRELAESTGPVIDNVLDEVSRYNLENGEIVSDDPQMQILHDLAADKASGSRRSAHLEEMETNEEAGGTTRNIYASDISGIPSNTVIEQPAPAAREKTPEEQLGELENGTEIDADDLVRMFASQPADFASTPAQEEITMQSEIVAQEAEPEEPEEKSVSKKGGFFTKRKKNRKKPESKTEIPAELADDSEDEEEEIVIEVPAKPEPLIEKNDETEEEPAKKPSSLFKKKAAKEQADETEEATPKKAAVQTRASAEPPASKAATIFLVCISIVFVIAIILLIYGMSSLGVF